MVMGALQDKTILKIAKEGIRTAQQVLLQWGLQHGETQHVSVIPKSANPDHQRVTPALDCTLAASALLSESCWLELL